MVKIKDTKFDTIMEAIKSDYRTPLIVLDADISEDVIIPRDKIVSIDLAGHTLTNVEGDTVVVNGNCTLFDSVGGGKVDCITDGKSAVHVNVDATATIGVICDRSAETSTADNTWYVVWNEGTCAFTKGSKVIGTSSYTSAIRNGFHESQKARENEMAYMLFVDGEFDSHKITVKNDEGGSVRIAGGKFTCDNECVLNWNKLAIEGGEFESREKEAIWTGTWLGELDNPAVSDGNTEIKGGKFKGVGADLKNLGGSEGYGPVVTMVEGGTFTNPVAPEFVAPNLIAITNPDGTISFTEGGWDVDNGGATGGGFMGLKRVIMHKDVLKYTAGGFEIPVDVMSVDAVIVNVKGGADAYFDNKTKKIMLFRAGTEISGDAEDVTIVIIGQ